MARLHAAGISHGRLNPGTSPSSTAKPLLMNLAAATLGAPQTAIDIDVAELLVACTVLVGPERALHAACDGAGDDAVAGALPYLERAALTPHTRDLARVARGRAEGAPRVAAAARRTRSCPELAAVRRVRARDFLFTALIAARGVPADHEAREDRLRHDLRTSCEPPISPGWWSRSSSPSSRYVPQAVALRGRGRDPAAAAARASCSSRPSSSST